MYFFQSKQKLVRKVILFDVHGVSLLFGLVEDS